MAEIQLYNIQKDYVFKRIFGQESSKCILISLLNAILHGNPKIEDITFINTKIPNEGQDISIDVLAKTSDGQIVQIGIQSQEAGKNSKMNPQNTVDMIIENTYIKMVDNEIKETLTNDWKSYRYLKIINIWIMGDNITDRKSAINELCMMYKPTPIDGCEIISDDVKIVFIELLKANPKDLTHENMLDMWLAFLQNPLKAQKGEYVKEIDQAFKTLQCLSEDEEFKSLAEKIENARTLL